MSAQGENLLKELVINVEQRVKEDPRPPSDPAGDLLGGDRAKTEVSQRHVGGVGDILSGVDQRPIEIKDPEPYGLSGDGLRCV